MDGVINVLKPPGMTSHDVVSFLRRELQEKRIGHAGTLDPQAAGVLPVCVGQATRLVEYLSSASKEYLCHLVFGITTTTQDAWGQLLDRRDAAQLSQEQIESVLPRFRGEITQLAPAFSAVKVKGVPLYKRARQGEAVEPIPRQVVIHDLKVLWYQAPVLSMLVHCSKGTYIRTLCHDLGQAVGLGGHMAYLLRTRVGDFKLAESYTLEEISSLKEKALLPLEYCVRELPRYVGNQEEIRRLKHGQKIQVSGPVTGPNVAVLAEDGSLQAIVELSREGAKQFLRPKKILR